MTDTVKTFVSTEELWLQFKNSLSLFIRQKVKNEYDAEDILQEVFIKVHLKKENLRDPSKIQAWLYQVTRNAIADFYRRPKALLKAEFEDLTGPEEHEVSGSSAQCLPGFLNRLPQKYREALEFAEVKGIPQNQLAIKFSVSYSGLKSRVQRAKQMIKELYVRCCGKGEGTKTNDLSCSTSISCGCN